MSCESNGQFRWFYTGNQVGCLNETGYFNFVAGGPPGSGIAAGTLVKKFFQSGFNRALWQGFNAELSQNLLNASWPFIELQWIAEISITNDVTFNVSNRNIYVEDTNGAPRFYQARAEKSPILNITAGEWLSPGFEIGNLKITLNNRDGFFNDYLPHGEQYTQWIGGEVKILVGFGESRSNYFEVFTGIIPKKKGIETTLETVIINAYDKQEEDKVEIPTLIYDRTNFPFVDSDKIGQPLPIVYGDWTTDLSSEFGDIPAICSNAKDDPVISYVWNISENALREIGDIYLHRGNRNESGNGPIRFLDSAITKEPEKGRVLIPFGIPVLEEVFVLIDNGKPGIVGSIGEVVAESSKQDFIMLGVQPGDTIYKEGDTTPYSVLGVTNGAVQTSIPTVMTPDNNYKILTDKYVFKSGDKISVVCKGKDIEVLSTTRLSDSNLLTINPLILSIGLENDFWTLDNDAQKIYNVSFNNEIIAEYDFADISPDITEITGLDIQTDGTLWLFDRPLSKIYRYVLSENALGTSFSTLQIAGLAAILPKGGPLSIDDGNIITLHDQINGNFYRINPFAGVQPGLVTTWNRNAFNPLAIDCVDIAADVNLNQIIILDRETNKVYRVDQDNGAFISSLDLVDKVASNFDQGRGVGYYIDGTIFLLNKQDLSIYNYNEFEGANENPGFIARDILQSYAGKSTFDFDLKWNEQCRGSLADLKCRVSIDSATNTLDFIATLLQSYNVSMFLSFQRYSLFHVTFDNFSTNGLPIREGDIKIDTFNPKKEFEQYFNSAYSRYKKRPFTNVTIASDNYVSPTGVQLANGKEIKKELNLSPIYRREDLDIIMPLFVRLAAAEPEFIDLTVGFRFLFAQLNTFYNINFKDIFKLTGKSGRRFDNIPSFVRQIQLDLDNMEIKLKLWSLGTTQFGDFVPVGVVGGGQNDQIILTNLGTAGYVAPIGDIVGSTINSVDLANVDAIDAENRQEISVGKAWVGGYKVGLYSGIDHTLIEELEIDNIAGPTVTFKSNIASTVENTIRNSASFISDGHYLKYLDFDKVKLEQTTKFGYYGKPIEGYSLTTAEEVEDQRAGKHTFDNGRLPYVLHPLNFVPT